MPVLNVRRNPKGIEPKPACIQISKPGDGRVALVTIQNFLSDKLNKKAELFGLHLKFPINSYIYTYIRHPTKEFWYLLKPLAKETTHSIAEVSFQEKRVTCQAGGGWHKLIFLFFKMPHMYHTHSICP